MLSARALPNASPRAVLMAAGKNAEEARPAEEADGATEPVADSVAVGEGVGALEPVAEADTPVVCVAVAAAEADAAADGVAAADAKKTVRLVKVLTQSRDHPILPAVPETEYLRGLLLEVV